MLILRKTFCRSPASKACGKLCKKKRKRAKGQEKDHQKAQQMMSFPIMIGSIVLHVFFNI
jgi:hypothetical protein